MNCRLHALAYIYDHLCNAPAWIRRLTPSQIEAVATLFSEWLSSIREDCEITPLPELERREITRALTLLNGDVTAAARALRVGKTTLYRKMKKWGYRAESRVLMHQASALGGATPLEAVHLDGRYVKGLRTRLS